MNHGFTGKEAAPDLINEGILIKGTVAEWRDVSLYADMEGQRQFADWLWALVENLPKERFKRIRFFKPKSVAFIRRIREAQNLALVEVPP